MPKKYEMIEDVATGMTPIADLENLIIQKRLSKAEVADKSCGNRQQFYNYCFNKKMPVHVYRKSLSFVKNFTV